MDMGKNPDKKFFWGVDSQARLGSELQRQCNEVEREADIQYQQEDYCRDRQVEVEVRRV